MTAADFWDIAIGWAIGWGTFYAYIDHDESMVPIALYPLASDRTRKVRVDGRLMYETRVNGEKRLLYPFQVYTFSNFKGLSVVDLFRQSLGLGLATEKYAAKLFGSGSAVRGILEHPGQLSDKAADALRTTWQQQFVGLDAAHKVAILEEG